jgi:hypothetical protein
MSKDPTADETLERLKAVFVIMDEDQPALSRNEPPVKLETVVYGLSSRLLVEIERS